MLVVNVNSSRSKNRNSNNRNGYRRIQRVSVMLLLVSLVTGCAWYQELRSPSDIREGMLPNRSLDEQDEYMKRFYELQKRVVELEQSLAKQTPTQTSTPTKKHDNNVLHQINIKAEQVIADVRTRAATSIAKVDALLSGIEPIEKLEEPAEIISKTVTNGAVSGELIRDNSGKVVSATTHSQRYNYSVVYIYPETQPWFDMWSLLEEQNIKDKWRGKNADKNSYFIYVGAYYTPSPAELRKNNLLALTGHAPEIRIRQGYDALVSR